MLQITLNGNQTEYASGTTMADLVTDAGIAPRQVAVERNGAIVPRSQWDSTAISAQDRIELVTLIGGG